MANEYATAPELIARVPSLSNADPGALDAILEAASRGIDAYCGRKFWLDPTATDRDFKAIDFYELDLGPYEIGTTGSVTVTTDDGSGTFGTSVSSSDYVLEPVNAPHEPRGAAPYTRIRLVSGCWPRVYYCQGRQELVRVTARYGWPSVPPAVREATLALAVVAVENPTNVRSEAIDGYSVSYGRDVVSDIHANPTISARLRSFRRSWAA